MLLRPEAAATREPGLGSILAPLDGTPEAEAVLPVATSIARTAGAPVRLLLVVPTVGTVRGDRAATARVSPLATAALLDVEQENAVEYLESVGARLREGGVEASGAVMRGDAVDVVAEGARRPEIGLVAMASHGRSGFAALWSGSVGTGVQARVEKPMLLLNPARAEPGHDRGAETGR